MDRVRECDLINLVNMNLSPDTLDEPMTEGEKAYYESMLREKAKFKEETGKDLMFELPMESYNDIW